MRVLKLNCPDRRMEFQGDVVFNTMEYFAVVDLTVVVARLDYKLRMHNYQLSQFNNMSP